MKSFLGSIRHIFPILSKDKAKDRGLPLEQRLRFAIGRNDHERVKFLLTLGADPNCVVLGNEIKPLHIAIESADLKMIDLLLDNGANPLDLITIGPNKAINYSEYARIFNKPHKQKRFDLTKKPNF